MISLRNKSIFFYFKYIFIVNINIKMIMFCLNKIINFNLLFFLLFIEDKTLIKNYLNVMYIYIVKDRQILKNPVRL